MMWGTAAMVSTLFTIVGWPKAPFDRGERRLDLGPALLALEGGEQARLLAADVGARSSVHHDVEVEARALDVSAPSSPAS